MIAFRYGTIPIARKTGGLADTVIEKNQNQTGFCFTPYSKKALRKALERAFQFNGTKRQSLIKKIMNLDYSWDRSMKEYLKIYRSRRR